MYIYIYIYIKRLNFNLTQYQCDEIPTKSGGIVKYK